MSGLDNLELPLFSMLCNFSQNSEELCFVLNDFLEAAQLSITNVLFNEFNHDVLKSFY